MSCPSFVHGLSIVYTRPLVCSKTVAWYRYRSPQCHLESIQCHVECGASDHTFRECIPSYNCLGEERTFKIVSPALVCTGMAIRQTTANHHKPPQTTTNHRKPPPEFGTISGENGENGEKQVNHRKPPQTTANHHHNNYEKKEYNCPFCARRSIIY